MVCHQELTASQLTSLVMLGSFFSDLLLTHKGLFLHWIYCNFMLICYSADKRRYFDIGYWLPYSDHLCNTHILVTKVFLLVCDASPAYQGKTNAFRHLLLWLDVLTTSSLSSAEAVNARSSVFVFQSRVLYQPQDFPCMDSQKL